MELIEPAIARVLTDDAGVRGTAFAVEPRIALTAFHCVSSPGDASSFVHRVALEFYGTTTGATVREGSASADWAVLLLDQPLPPQFQPYLMAPDDAQVFTNTERSFCTCLGFAVDAIDMSAASHFGALVEVVTRTRWNGSWALQLQVQEVAAGMKLHGMSGAPLIGKAIGTTSTCVAIVHSHLGDREDPSRPVGGVGYACPVDLCSDAVERIRDEISGDAESQRPPRSYNFPDDLTLQRELEDLERAARAGDASAAYLLGRRLESVGLPEEAMLWFRQAATGGSVYGAVTFGIRLHTADRSDAAIPWLEAAVELGDVMAAATLGLIFWRRALVLREGGDFDGAQSSVGLAARWTEFASERGDTMSMHTLAQICRDQNDLEGFERWERGAAEGGDAKASSDLAWYLYNDGRVEEARKWATRAAPADPDARSLLDQLDQPK